MISVPAQEKIVQLAVQTIKTALRFDNEITLGMYGLTITEATELVKKVEHHIVTSDGALLSLDIIKSISLFT